MRLALLAVLLIPSASAIDLSFHTPFQVEGDAVTQASWALLVFAPGDAARADVEATDARHIDHTLLLATADVHRPQTLAYRDQVPVPAGPEDLGTFAARLDAAGWGSVFIAADHLKATTTGEAQVDVARRGTHPSAGDGSPGWTYRPDLQVPTDGPAAAWGEGTFTLEAEGLHVLEYHEAGVTCRSGSCPPSAWSEHHAAGLDVADTSVRTVHFVEVLARSGRVQVAGDAHAIVLGGGRVDLEVLGIARLPQARQDHVDLGGTVLLEGSIAFNGLHAVDAGRVAASVSGDYTGAWLDEEPTDPTRLGGWGKIAVATAGAGALVVAWLLGLRIRRPEDLGDRAKELLHCIQAQPGLHSVELAKAARMSRTSVRHHLAVLERTGCIVRHRVGRTWHVYENHGRYGLRDQAIIASTRDARTRAILLRIARHPATQNEIIQFASRFDMPRSTAQDSLRRLVESCCVRTWREDGHRWYSA